MAVLDINGASGDITRAAAVAKGAIAGLSASGGGVLY
jgi:hypothetical protein